VRPSSTWVIAAVVVAAVLFRPLLLDVFDGPRMRLWSTLFVAVCFQALPFLVLGVVVSGAIATFVNNDALARLLPRRAIFAIPMAAGAGVILPGCECSSVPVASRLVERGAPPAAALAFLLASPAVNPVVMVATAVAFPGQPKVVIARFLASFFAATAMGLAWSRRPDLAPVPRHQHRLHGPWFVRLATAVQHDALHAGGFLVLGAATAATLQTLVDRSTMARLGDNMFVAIVSMAILAVILAVCSEADAFVAAGFNGIPLSARLVFLTVGPMVDVKLVALQAGTFGRSFTMRFAPATLVCATVSASLFGWWLL
jgi:uncharacterized protein